MPDKRVSNGSVSHVYEAARLKFPPTSAVLGPEAFEFFYVATQIWQKGFFFSRIHVVRLVDRDGVRTTESENKEINFCLDFSLHHRI
jgi:hypothetical protein